VPSLPVHTKSPVAIGSTASFGGGVTAKVIKAEAVQSSGSGPGEFTGQPAVAFTIRLTNSSAKPLSLSTVVVNASYGRDATPAVPDDGKTSHPMSGQLMPGQSASGVYVFLIPTEERKRVAVSVSYAARTPTVVFTGDVS
jgi:hypothetical protein